MARESRKPLLAVDVGNTQTVLGLFEDGHLGRRWRLATEAQRTGDELGIFLRGLLDLESLGGICLSSSVPTMVRAFEEVADEVEARLLVLGPGTKTGIPIRYDDPRELGPDRIANAVAARERYGTPCIVVDFGTSTNFDVVSAAGEFVGGVLAPGIEVSMEALFERAARLGQVDFVEPPSAIGKTTSSALQAGLVYGFAGQVDGIVERIRTELGDGAALVVATGGLASLIVPHAKTVERVDPFLTLEGLRLVWERNRE
jgi:type III pantothenate kinase